MRQGSRCIDDGPGQDREAALNLNTLPPGARYDNTDFEKLFELQYDVIRERIGGMDEPGVGCVAVDRATDEVACSIWLKAKPDVINAAMIGRHSRCDLFLDQDRSVSLRHCVLLIRPLESPEGPVTYRITDLRTKLKFTDEWGNRLEAIETQGSVFITCGRYALFFFVTGVGYEWPDNAAAAWAKIPNRVYLDEKTALSVSEDGSAESSDEEAPPPNGAHFDTLRDSERRRAVVDDSVMVSVMAGPQRLKIGDPADRPIGCLHVCIPDESRELELGQMALERGILLGYYDRCDDDYLSLLDDRNISRVHLLITKLGDSVYAVDTASTNGMYVRGRRYRIALLSPSYELMLGRTQVYLRWQPK